MWEEKMSYTEAFPISSLWRFCNGYLTAEAALNANMRQGAEGRIYWQEEAVSGGTVTVVGC